MKSVSSLSVEEIAALAEAGAKQAAEAALSAGVPVTGLRVRPDGSREIVKHFPDGSETLLESFESSRLPAGTHQAKAIRGRAAKR